MKKISARIVILLVALCQLTQALKASELVYIPRSWLSVKELLSTAQEQTGVVLHCNVEDTLKKMVLYDNLTDLASVREAALEYYIYVLKINAHWRQQGRDWVLEAHIHLDAPIAVNLPALEDLWRQRLEQEAIDAQRLLSAQAPSKNPTATIATSGSNVKSGEAPLDGHTTISEPPLDGHLTESEPRLVSNIDNHPESHITVANAALVARSKTRVKDRTNSTDAREQEDTASESAAPWIDEALPEDDVSRQWVDRSLYMMDNWWSKASSKERSGMRRLWKNSNAIGRVPLMALVLAGKINFDMGAEASLASMKARTENFSMGPSSAISKLAESENLRASEVKVEDSSLMPNISPDFADLATAMSNTESSKGIIPLNSGWRWPKHIVSFSANNWWQVLMGRRVIHPIDPPVPKTSAHVLERRDQARRIFEEMSDELEEKRDAQQIRRQKE